MIKQPGVNKRAQPPGSPGSPLGVANGLWRAIGGLRRPMEATGSRKKALGSLHKASTGPNRGRKAVKVSPKGVREPYGGSKGPYREL